jgi:hypothetical protein
MLSEVCKATGLAAAEIGNHTNEERVHAMLYTLAIILLVLWVLGLVTSYTMGGFIHILLVIAIIAVLYNIISGRKIA